MDQSAAKLAAAQAAIHLLPSSGTIGLGSGSTAKLFIDEIGKRVAQGSHYRGVATSQASYQQAKELNIPLLSDDGPWNIDVCVDGADEVDSNYHLIKGGGGALTREKIVNASSIVNIIIVDSSKRSSKLGEKWPVPIEVVRFGHAATARILSKFGTPQLRMHDNHVFQTDGGNVIYDVNVGLIDDPVTLEQQLSLIPGVVETGLFVNRTSVLVVAGQDSTQVIRVTQSLYKTRILHESIKITSLHSWVCSTENQLRKCETLPDEQG
jgi:ribose 5-phosphate isomerase A